MTNTYDSQQKASKPDINMHFKIENNGDYVKKEVKNPVIEIMKDEYRDIMWKYMTLFFAPLLLGLVLLGLTLIYTLDHIVYERLLTSQQEIHTLSSEIKELKMLLERK